MTFLNRECRFFFSNNSIMSIHRLSGLLLIISNSLGIAGDLVCLVMPLLVSPSSRLVSRLPVCCSPVAFYHPLLLTLKTKNKSNYNMHENDRSMGIQKALRYCNSSMVNYTRFILGKRLQTVYYVFLILLN